MNNIKNFFDNTRLNKGYDETTIVKEKTNNYNKFDQIAPSLDSLILYEKLHPGATKILLDYLEKEQSHRLNLNNLNFTYMQRSFIIGKYFGLTILALICYTTLQIIKTGNTLLGFLFIVVAFGSLFGISTLSYFRKKVNNQAYSFKGNLPSPNFPSEMHKTKRKIHNKRNLNNITEENLNKENNFNGSKTKRRRFN